MAQVSAVDGHRVDLIGAVTVHGPAGAVMATRPQVQVALAFLLLEARPVGRGEVAELLWGERPLSEHWQGAVRGVLSKVRDLLVEAGVDGQVQSGRDGTVRLAVPDDFTTDVQEAKDAVARAEQALVDGDAEVARAAIAPWVDVLQQPFLPAGDGDWVRLEQDRLADLARRAATLEIDALLASDRPDLAASAAATWVRRHPLDEGVHEQSIRALLADGRRGEAIEAHRRLAALLADELGVGPSAAISALVAVPQAPRQVEAHALPPVAAPAAPADRVFLGRRSELDELVAAWHATVAGQMPRMVVISGRSGIGKTRLAEELGGATAALGAEVRWARCMPGAGLPFEPLAAAVSTPGRGRADDDAPTDPGLARAEALRSIGDGMRSLAAAPSVLVIDDLQWADDDMAAALEHTLVPLRGPLLVVTTGRSLPPGIHEVLGRLQRSLPTTTVRLRELDPGDLLPLFDGEGAEAGAGDLHRRTGGHPFFVTEVAIAPWRAGRPIDADEVPEAVRDWIGHRAEALDKPLRARLDLAAVIGDECSIDTLARCAHVSPDDVLDQVEVLVEDGFLVETDQVDVFAFPHLITRDAIYERIGPSRRARLHAAVAEALAAERPRPGRLALIAHHLGAAGPAHATEAGRMLLLAGREALDSGAWAQAEQRYRAANDAAPDDPAIRAGALTGLARAAHLQRRRDEAEALIDEALAIARAHRLPLEVAEAVLVLVGRAGRGATTRLTDLQQADLLREALDGIAALEASAPLDRGEMTSADLRAEQVRRETLACQLEGELALAVALTAPADERSEMARRAVARARRIDPPDTHLTARALLIARLARLDPGDVRSRIDDLDQVLAIAPSGRSVDATLAALTYRHEDLALCGDHDASLRALEEAVALAERSEHPYWRWATSAWLGLGSLIAGDLDRAEQQAFAAAAIGADEPGAQACLGVNLVNIRLYQGRSAEVLDLLAGAADAFPHIPCYRAVHALCAVEAGEAELASASYDAFRSSEFQVIPEDTNRLLTLVVLADTAVQLGDADSAPVLRALLAPASGLNAILNCYGGGGAYWGPVAHQIARLDALVGDHDAADAWFARAERSADAMAAPLARARIDADPVRVPQG